MDRYRAAHCLLGIVLIIILEGAGIADIAITSWLLVVSMLINKTIMTQDIKKSINVDALLTSVSALAMGFAVEKTDLGNELGTGMANAFSAMGEFGSLCGLFLSTAWLGAFVGNDAAALVMLPTVLKAADDLSKSPRLFFFVLIYGANASFIFPMGFQTNLMVANPGKYGSFDYFRFGIGLQIILSVVAVGLCICIWG